MSHYAVQAFFEAHPKSKEVFETYDGVLHVNKEVADKWISMHAYKTVTRHERQKPADVATVVKPVKPEKAAKQEKEKGGKADKKTPDPKAPGSPDASLQEEPNPNPEPEPGKEPLPEITNQ